jgi:hypothetical protein
MDKAMLNGQLWPAVARPCNWELVHFRDLATGIGRRRLVSMRTVTSFATTS